MCRYRREQVSLRQQLIRCSVYFDHVAVLGHYLRYIPADLNTASCSPQKFFESMIPSSAVPSAAVRHSCNTYIPSSESQTAPHSTSKLLRCCCSATLLRSHCRSESCLNSSAIHSKISAQGLILLPAALCPPKHPPCCLSSCPVLPVPDVAVTLQRYCHRPVQTSGCNGCGYLPFSPPNVPFVTLTMSRSDVPHTTFSPSEVVAF